MQIYIENLHMLERMILSNQNKITQAYLMKLSNDFQKAHIFEIDGMIGRLLLLTNNTVRNDVRLPFPSIFVDVMIDTDKFRFYGFTASEIASDIEIATVCDIKKENRQETMIFSLYQETPTLSGAYDESTEPKLIEKLKGDRKKIKNLMRQFVMNFHDLLADPNITLITHKRNEKNIERRKKQGKIPLPPSTVVKVNGELAKYT